MGATLDPFYSRKALRWAERCEKLARGELCWPVMLTVYPTNRCNRNCRWCIMREEQRSGAELPANVWRELLGLDIPCLRVTGGGEPTLYPYLAEAARFKGLRVLDSNGVALTRETCAGFHRVRISLNAGTAEGYRDVTGRPANEWEELVDRCVMLCAKPRAWSIGAALVADTQTPEEISQFVRLVEFLGFDWAYIRPAYYPPGDDADRTVRNWPAISRAARAAAEGGTCDVRVTSEKFSGYWQEPGYERCRATCLEAVVTADARLTLCKDVFRKWGDLRVESFENAWWSMEHEDIVRSIDLTKCPRCVMGPHNETIEQCFVNNAILAELL